MEPVTPAEIRAAIRAIPGYPKPGIVFRDITTLLGDARVFRGAIDLLVLPWARERVDRVAGIEARGFILGGAVAHQLAAGFVPVRKKGKLPHDTIDEEYSLEYGTASLEIHRDACTPGERVLVVDDVLATGGTAKAAASLVERIGGKVCGIATLIELEFLHGRDKLEGYDLFTLIRY